MSERLVLPADASAARRARVAVARACRAEGLADDATALALLLTSELVTNAVRHGEDQPVLTIRLGPTRVRVEVGDASDELPVVVAAPRGATGGRGLAIVERLAGAWGVLVAPEGLAGKVVWFEVDAD